MYELTLVEHGTEAQVLSLHKQILGRTMTLVDVAATAVYIRVLPTYTEGNLPLGDDTVVWANVYWNGQDYTCIVYGIDRISGGWSSHATLRSALRRARKTVARNATLSPNKGWTKHLVMIKDLVSLVPTTEQIYWDRIAQQNMRDDCLRSMEIDDMFDADRFEDSERYTYG